MRIDASLSKHDCGGKVISLSYLKQIPRVWRFVASRGN